MKSKPKAIECIYVNDAMIYESMPIASAEKVFTVLEALANMAEKEENGLMGDTPLIIVTYEHEDGTATLNVFKTENGWMRAWSICVYRRWMGLPLPAKTTDTDLKDGLSTDDVRAEILKGFEKSIAEYAKIC